MPQRSRHLLAPPYRLVAYPHGGVAEPDVPEGAIVLGRQPGEGEPAAKSSKKSKG